MIVVGVDENGLGPRLGPLVSTAVAISVQSYDPARLRARARRVGIDDSKQTAGFGKMASAESIALALVAELTGSSPRDADALLAAVALDGALALRAPCPPGTSAQCWSSPLALPAFGGDVDEGKRALARLARAGVRVRRARSAIACASVVNDWLSRDRTKLDLDLEQFERLLVDARSALDEDMTAYCGMVGGIRRYGARFAHLDSARVAVLAEEKARAAYRVLDFGEIAFEVGADARHFPVALASMLGKYVRELAMERMHLFYGTHDEALPRASGYHDPVTARFVTATGALRLRLGIVDHCFERRG